MQVSTIGKAPEFTFTSPLRDVGEAFMPAFTGKRIMMMPIDMGNLDHSLPGDLGDWREIIKNLCGRAGFKEGVGYLTLDEKEVQAGSTQRRPGLHVDGVGDMGGTGVYGGGYASNGMILLSSYTGCRGWNKVFKGKPLPNGDCAHLAEQCESGAIVLKPNRAYTLGSHTVHEGLPLDRTVGRQFLRISSPSDAPWHVGYTPNPTGTLPAGAIQAPRPAAFMRGLNS